VFPAVEFVRWPVFVEIAFETFQHVVTVAAPASAQAAAARCEGAAAADEKQQRLRSVACASCTMKLGLTTQPARIATRHVPHAE